MDSKSSQSLSDVYSSQRPDSKSSQKEGNTTSNLLKLLPILIVALTLGAAVYGVFVFGLSTHQTTTSGEPHTIQSASDYVSLYETTKTSTVSVYVQTSNGDAQGSGFIYDDVGHVITNEHVVGTNAENIYIEFSTGEWSEATIVGTDVSTDIAVLRTESVPENAHPLPLLDGVPSPGERVIALGSPNNLEYTLTEGTVSGVERSMQMSSGYLIPDLIQTDAALNPGNSGGPLLTPEGVVVGVNRATTGENLGFAISSRVTKIVADSLIETGEHAHPRVGIQTAELTPPVAQANELPIRPGVLLTAVVADGPANSVLPVKESDVVEFDGRTYNKGSEILVAIDDVPIHNSEQLSSILIRNYLPGDDVTLTLYSATNGEYTATFTLGSR